MIMYIKSIYIRFFITIFISSISLYFYLPFFTDKANECRINFNDVSLSIYYIVAYNILMPFIIIFLEVIKQKKSLDLDGVSFISIIFEAILLFGGLDYFSRAGNCT